MSNKGYMAECIHARNCARPRVLSAAVDHVQGDDYPVYSEYVAFYYNDVGQRVTCEETDGMNTFIVLRCSLCHYDHHCNHVSS